MKRIFVFLLSTICLSFVTSSCFHTLSSSEQECIDLLSKEIEHSKTSFIFIGAQWCRACKPSLEEQFLQNPLLQEDSIGVMVIYFSDKSHFDKLLSEVNYKGSFYRFDSRGGLDKMVANNILKKIIPDFQKVNYMPIMLEIDSLGNYSHWSLRIPSSCAPNEN